MIYAILQQYAAVVPKDTPFQLLTVPSVFLSAVSVKLTMVPPVRLSAIPVASTLSTATSVTLFPRMYSAWNASPDISEMDLSSVKDAVRSYLTAKIVLHLTTALLVKMATLSSTKIAWPLGVRQLSPTASYVPQLVPFAPLAQVVLPYLVGHVV